MTDCEIFDDDLAESPELDRLPRRARAHAGACVRCAHILTDLETIVAKAGGLAQVDPAPEPPPEMWDNIRRQLEKEGIIQANGSNARPPKTKPKTGSLPRLVHSAPRSSS